MKGTAREVQPLQEGSHFRNAKMYQLCPPLKYTRWEEGGEVELRAEYVAISTSYMFGGGETYIFHVREDGSPVHWGELPGSASHPADDSTVLREAGYEIQATTH